VIEEMGKDISEHNNAGSKAHLPHANAAQQYRRLGISIYARCANVNERGCLCCHGGPSFEWQIGGSKRAVGFDALYKQKDHGTLILRTGIRRLQ
jgi:hypothetical protein